jgi:hypothetical protein
LRAPLAGLSVEHCLAAAFNRVTAAFLNPEQQFLHGFDLFNYLFEFLQLLCRQFFPSL